MIGKTRNRLGQGTWGILVLTLLAIGFLIFLFGPMWELKAQSEVILSPKPSTAGIAVVMDYSGTNLLYLGKAPAPTSYTHVYSVATCATTSVYWPHCSQMTNIVDAANTATVTAANHGLKIGDRVCVTGASDADLNVCAVILTVADVNTWTMASANTSDATYTTNVLITTRAPRNVDAIWKIQRYILDGSSNLVGILTSGAQAKWVNRTTEVYY